MELGASKPLLADAIDRLFGWADDGAPLSLEPAQKRIRDALNAGLVGRCLGRDGVGDEHAFTYANGCVSVVRQKLQRGSGVAWKVGRAKDGVEEREAELFRSLRPDEEVRQKGDGPAPVALANEERAKERRAFAPATGMRGGAVEHRGRALHEQERRLAAVEGIAKLDRLRRPGGERGAKLARDRKSADVVDEADGRQPRSPQHMIEREVIDDGGIAHHVNDGAALRRDPHPSFPRRIDRESLEHRCGDLGQHGRGSEASHAAQVELGKPVAERAHGLSSSGARAPSIQRRARVAPSKHADPRTMERDATRSPRAGPGGPCDGKYGRLARLNTIPNGVVSRTRRSSRPARRPL